MKASLRERGFTAKEMAYNRDQVNNSLKPVSDEKLSLEQTKKRLQKHNKVVRKGDDNIIIGDDVYVKNDKSKQRAREKYKVVKLFREGDEEWAILQKNNSKFMAKEYKVKIAEVFPAIKKKPDEKSLDEKNIAEPLESDEKESETEGSAQEQSNNTCLDSEGKENDKFKDPEEPLNQSDKPRGSRKAASAAREKFKHYRIKEVNSELNEEIPGQPRHVWNYSDWLKLIEENDETGEPIARETAQSRLPSPRSVVVWLLFQPLLIHQYNKQVFPNMSRTLILVFLQLLTQNLLQLLTMHRLMLVFKHQLGYFKCFLPLTNLNLSGTTLHNS